MDAENQQMEMFSLFDTKQIEKEIIENQNEFDFDIREYTIDFLVQQFNPDPEANSDIYIPEYQRDDVWTDKQKSLFIESLLIGLPIPYIFIADIDEKEEPDADGRVEIIDGSQRSRTIYQFRNNKLKLKGMERVPSLEGAKFSDLPPSRQRRFNRTTIRLIELKNINEDGRRLMFERLNSGGSELTEMEKRIGTEDGEFLSFIRDLAAKDSPFEILAPVSKQKSKRAEHAEYVLRFFAYRENYLGFEHKVRDFLNDYLDVTSASFDEAKKAQLNTYFFEMLAFVVKHFPNGFRKSQGAKSVSRIRFEATAVGVSLALAENPDLINAEFIDTSWAYEDPFVSMIRSDASNSRVKVKARIEYVKNKLLGIKDDAVTDN